LFLKASRYNSESHTLLCIMNKVKLLKYDQSTTTEANIVNNYFIFIFSYSDFRVKV